MLRLSLLFNLPFILFRVHRQAFDTYTHLFLADHYRLRWWSLWEPRWYLGFSVASYPPLVHQLIALISWPAGALVTFFAPEPEPYAGAFRALGEEIGYLAVLLAALALFPLAMRAFARQFVGPRAAGAAALLAVFLPALSLVAWSFGQLPTLLATSLVLFALARGAAFLRSGRRLELIQAALLAGAAGATHHGVFLLVPFAGAAVVLRWLPLGRMAASAREMWMPVVLGMVPLGARAAPGRLNRAFLRPHTAPRAGDVPPVVFLVRLAGWTALSALAAGLALWPFIQWSQGQSLQAPIDHVSRHNFLESLRAVWFFFLPMYGPLLALLPAAALMGLRRPRFWPLLAAVGVLMALGLGGTTPLPRLLFGEGWAWLTYDRFSFWAAALLLPFAGVLLARAGRRAGGHHLLPWAFLAALIAWSSFSGWLAVVARSQPQPVDPAPFVQLLNQAPNQRFRYLTLGFGDQFARLSLLTHNGTPDGAYHTARGLPELRASGIGALDTAVWTPQGVLAVLPFVAHPERYGLRWVFVNHPGYVPVLVATGWRFRWIEGGVSVWDHLYVRPVPLVEPEGQLGAAARWWGAAPLTFLALALAAVAAARRPWGLSRQKLAAVMRQARLAGLGATVILLSLWWMHVLRAGQTPGVYFLYQSVVLFASDAALAVTLIIWAAERGLRGERLRLGPKTIAAAGLGLIVLCGLSAVVSRDPVLSLAVAVHLLLLAGLYVMLVNDPPPGAWAGALFGAVVAAQAGVALMEARFQGTWPLPGIRSLPWPGALSVDSAGASVVQNAAGQRWFRAYGTLPHPNILGGMLLVYAGAMLERYWTTGRRAWLAVLAAGVMAGVLTFSRSAWLGAGVMAAAGALLIWHARGPGRRRAWVVLGIALAAALLSLWPLRSYVLARATGGGGPGAGVVGTEQRSVNERVLLIRQSLEMIRAHPLLGSGAGTFVIESAAQPDPDAPFQPVHNLLLLAAAETGLPGALAVSLIWGAVLWRIWQRRLAAGPAETAWALALLGALAVAMFDHFWWTLVPARTLLVMALGLWAGAAEQGGGGAGVRVGQGESG